MMKEANDSIYVIPGEGLFCLVRRETGPGYFDTRGLESLILSERALGQDTEELEQKLFTLRKYNHALFCPDVASSDWTANDRKAVPGQMEHPA